MNIKEYLILNGFVVVGAIFYLLKKRAAPVSRFRSSRPQSQIMFNYNGHTWEAYETLGLPPGASFEAAQKAFEEIAAQSDQESIAFLVAAIEAIREGVAVQRRSHDSSSS